MSSITQPTSIEELLALINKNEISKPCPEALKVINEEASFPNCQSSLDKVVNVCNSLPIKEYKNSNFIFIFLFSRYIFLIAWKVRNLIFNIKPNSSYFALDLKTINKINRLVKNIR